MTVPIAEINVTLTAFGVTPDAVHAAQNMVEDMGLELMIRTYIRQTIDSYDALDCCHVLTESVTHNVFTDFPYNMHVMIMDGPLKTLTGVVVNGGGNLQDDQRAVRLDINDQVATVNMNRLQWDE